MKMMIKLDLINGHPVCETKECSYWKDCAQHGTAGDYRSEGGLTPKLFLDAYGDCFCNKKVEDEECGQGLLTIENKKLKYYYSDYWNHF